jgi:hypothetical protein
MTPEIVKVKAPECLTVKFSPVKGCGAWSTVCFPVLFNEAHKSIESARVQVILNDVHFDRNAAIALQVLRPI